MSLLSIKDASMGHSTGGSYTTVLNHVELDLQAGDFVALLGENGSGKSTFIRTCSGLLPLLSGSVFVNGVELSRNSFRDLSKQLSLVLTGSVPGFNMNVFDLVASGQRPYTNVFHQLDKQHKDVIEEAMKQMGILSLANKKLKELSDGNFQKALIAKALAQNTALMLLDEPGAFLDFASKHRLFEQLRDLSEHKGKCILVSSHDLHLVKRYCNKILLLENGSAELIEAGVATSNAVFLRLGGSYL